MVIVEGSVIDGLVLFVLMLSVSVVLLVDSWLSMIDRLVIDDSWLDVISCGLIKASIIIRRSLILN